MRCAFSAPPLHALISAGCDVRAVVLPGSPNAATVIERVPSGIADHITLHNDVRSPASVSVDRLARHANVQILEIGNLTSPAVRQALIELAPDVIAVACFPWRIPVWIRELPCLGCLNVHPSLLPKWRGPEPLFWTFKAGENASGTTVHLMDGGFDTGPVVLQESVDLDSGENGRVTEHRLAELGGKLLVAAIDGLCRGRLTPVPQDEGSATYAPVPTDADLLLDPGLPADRVSRFVCGVAPLWGPLTLLAPDTGETLLVEDVFHHDLTATQVAPIIRDGNVVYLRCNPGIVRLRISTPNSGATLTLFRQV
jgi:methionyl-tRNA formyltransferase